jgi:hypothetical protein
VIERKFPFGGNGGNQVAFYPLSGMPGFIPEKRLPDVNDCGFYWNAITTGGKRFPSSEFSSAFCFNPHSNDSLFQTFKLLM